MRAWADLLGAVASPSRPVVLALHPGTAAALAAAGVSLAPTIRVIEPQGYRTTLALQLHAAAVLTDSGGVQREAAWLGVPCLVLRGTTEWLEAVDGSAGPDGRGRPRSPGRPSGTLARLAPGRAPGQVAIQRAAALELEPAGAGRGDRGRPRSRTAGLTRPAPARSGPPNRSD